MQVQLAYWRQQLAGLTALQLPTEHPRPPLLSSRGASHTFALPTPLHTDLLALSRREGATLFMTLLAAFQVLLARYSGQDDIVIGTDVANRNWAEVEDLIGFFVNQLVLRADLSADPTFSALLQQMRQVCLDAYSHQDLPFEQLVAELQPERHLNRSPLFQVKLILQNAPLETLDLGELALRPLAVEHRVTKLDLTLFLRETGAGLAGTLEYSTDLFTAPAIARMVEHFQTLLEGIVVDPGRRIGELPLLAESERRQLAAWNDTQAAYPQDLCVHQLFAAQAARTPDAVALVFDEPLPGVRGQGSGVRRPMTDDRSPLHPFTPSPVQCLTYHELNVRANRLAHHLHALGVGPDVLVGLYVERSVELVVGLLGVLKAGGAYVPLDPAYPRERIAFMLEDSRMPVLLTQAQLLGDLPASWAYVVCLDDDWPRIAREPADIPAVAVQPDNLAYMIYTSGSTGWPKGVLIAHRGLVNYLHWCGQAYAVGEGRGAPVHSPIGFDLTITSLFAPLVTGARAMLLSEGAGVEALGAALRAESGFSLVKLTPTHLALLGRLLPGTAACGARALIVGGEALWGESLAFWRTYAPSIRVFNEYGPTEAVVGCCVYEVPAGAVAAGAVPIGHPIANTEIYLLDRHMQPVPIGAPGEIYLGGVNLARGYHRRPDLTAERFVPNPFVQGMGDGGWGMEDSIPIPYPLSPIPRLYRTGDLGRRRPDGAIEYLGRNDQQVKIRGYRIELGEVEAALARHPAVREVAVTLREDAPGDRRLVAYVVPKNEDRGLKIEDSGSDAPDPLSSILYPRSSELRDFLKQKLPDYMLPSAFVVLDALPLTPNGKLDRRALPAPDVERADLDEVLDLPRTPAEVVVARIWIQTLGTRGPGIHENFFDLGGHSLLAAQVVVRLRDVFRVELAVQSLFERPTVAGLVAELAEVWGDRAVVDAIAQVFGDVERLSDDTETAPQDRSALFELLLQQQGIAVPRAQTIPRRDGPGPYPLSFAQQRLWFLDQLQPGNPAYNIPIAVRMTGPLDAGALEWSVGMVVRRHEVLRTTFAIAEGSVVQVIAPPAIGAAAAAFLLIDLCSLAADEREAHAERLALAEARRPFDLARGPLLRAVLLRLGRDDHLALLTMHHIVSDGWSMGVLIRELAALYAADRAGPSPLPQLPAQYADYAVWQRAWLQGQEDKETRRQGDKETGVRGQETSTSLPPPAGGGTEGGRSQESNVGEGQTQNSKLKTQNSPIEAQLVYWRQQLAGVPALELPADHPRPLDPTFQGASLRLALPAPLTEALAALSRAERVTLFMTLLAAFQTLLARYSGQDDIAVGAPIANRNQAETERLIGFFVNTLVLRTDLGGNPTFDEVLRRVRTVCLGAYAHQDLPFEQLVEVVQPERDLGHHPLFQVMLVLQNNPMPALDLPDLILRPVAIEQRTAKFDLTLDAVETADGLRGSLEYRTDLFDGATIARLLANFQTLLESIVADPGLPIAALALLTEAERHQLLVGWNPPPEPDYPEGIYIHRLFEAQVARTPDAIAIVCERPPTTDHRPPTTDHPFTPSPLHPFTPSPLHPFTRHRLTYDELNARANRLAHHLRSLGVGPEVLVGICAERSPEAAVAMLGVLKAGGAYVPLDPAYPAERLAFMLEDTQVAVLITTNDQRPTTNDQRPTTNDHPITPSPRHPVTLSPHHLVTLSESWPSIALCSTDDPVDLLDPANLAYVIYTSGSTGRPKGVLVTHRTLRSYMAAIMEHLRLGPDDRILQFASISFDATTEELYPALLSGAAVVLRPERIMAPGTEFAQLIERENLTVLSLPTAFWHEWVYEMAQAGGALPAALRMVLLNAEEPSPERFTLWRSLGGDRIRWINTYGPTEATVTATLYEPGAGVSSRGVRSKLPIGSPIPNTRLYLLDRSLRPVPIGAAGALYIGGGGVTRGYLNRPDLTAECFIPNPFWGMGDGGWGRVFHPPSPIPHPLALGYTRRAIWCATCRTATWSSSGGSITRSKSVAIASSWARSKRSSASIRPCARRWSWCARMWRVISGWWRMSCRRLKIED